MANTLFDTAQSLLDAVFEALSDDLRPVCKAYQTHGTPVIFTCCDCNDGEGNGEISIHFRRLFDADPATMDEVRRTRPCKGGFTAAQFRLVLARCRPTIDERGEIPSPDELTDHTDDQLRDVEILWQALACSGEIRVDDVTADLSEPGTCSVIYADVTVPIRVPALPSSSA